MSKPEVSKTPVKQKRRTGLESLAFNDGKREGYKIGHAEGMQEGKQVGFEEGKSKGIEEGKKWGRVEGRRQGKKEVYPIAYRKGRDDRLKEMATTIEEKMAEAAGYTDRQKWANEEKVPAWWIGVLVTFWESPHAPGPVEIPDFTEEEGGG